MCTCKGIQFMAALPCSQDVLRKGTIGMPHFSKGRVIASVGVGDQESLEMAATEEIPEASGAECSRQLVFHVVDRLESSPLTFKVSSPTLPEDLGNWLGGMAIATIVVLTTIVGQYAASSLSRTKAE